MYIYNGTTVYLQAVETKSSFSVSTMTRPVTDTVGNFMTCVRKNMPSWPRTSAYGRRRGQKWCDKRVLHIRTHNNNTCRYMYRGYNIPLCALFLVLIVCCAFASYHYRADIQVTLST